VGRDAGGAANNDGVTGSGLGTCGATGWTGSVTVTAGGSGEGVAEATLDACEAADAGVTEVGVTDVDACTGGVVGRGTLSLDALAAIEGCNGAGAASTGAVGFCSGTANSGVMGACSCTTGAGVAATGAAGVAEGAGAGAR